VAPPPVHFFETIRRAAGYSSCNDENNRKTDQPGFYNGSTSALVAGGFTGANTGFKQLTRYGLGNGLENHHQRFVGGFVRPLDGSRT